MNEQILTKLQSLLDLLWDEYGNGYNTEYEKLINEIQVIIGDYET